MKSLLLFLVSNLLILHKGAGVKISLWAATTLKIPSAVVKIIATAKIALAVSIPAYAVAWVSDWTVSNREYLAGVLVCIAVDHIVGSAYHLFKVRDFTFKRNAWGLMNKLLLCALAAALFEVIHNTVKDIAFVYEYLKVITRLIVILYPAGSAFMNMSALTNGVFPPLGWINKIKAFNQDLDLDRFKKEENKDNQNIE